MPFIHVDYVLRVHDALNWQDIRPTEAGGDMRWLIRSAMRTMYPATGPFKCVTDTGLDDLLDRYFKEAPHMLTWGLRSAVLAYHLLPIMTVFVPLPAFLLPKTWQSKHADRLARHPIYLLRSLAIPIKMVAGLAWATDPDHRRALGMPPMGADPGTWRTT